MNGEAYTTGFKGITAAPMLGQTPETRFVPQSGSPVIDAGRPKHNYYQVNVSDGKPDLGALEYGQDIADWSSMFGHCGPRWITKENAPRKASLRPEWPAELDKRWGGFE